MGIETISGITGVQSYQSQVSQTTRPTVQKVQDNEVTESTSQTSALSQPVAVSKADSENMQGSGSNGDNTKEKQSDETSMSSVAKDVNKLINNNTIAEFGYHEATHKITIKIKDKDTDEIIKEIPSEKALAMLQKAWELAGIIVDEKR